MVLINKELNSRLRAKVQKKARIPMEQRKEISGIPIKSRGIFRQVLRVVVGAALGYGFYLLVGCSTGACALTATPWIPTALGAIIAYVTDS